MDKLVEVLLMACVAGYIGYILVVIERYGMGVWKKVKRRLDGFVYFIRREKLTKKVFFVLIKGMPLVAVWINLEKGLAVSLAIGLIVATTLFVLWILIDGIIYGILRLIAIQNDGLTKLFIYLFGSITVVLGMLYYGEPPFDLWHIVGITMVLTVSYLCNFAIMIKMVSLISRKGRIPKNLWKVVVLIILFFIIILALAFGFANVVIDGGFNQKELTPLDLLYYTVISFATVGYGDIYPIHPVTKLITLITTVTSVLCLVVLVDVTMGVNDE